MPKHSDFCLQQLHSAVCSIRSYHASASVFTLYPVFVNRLHDRQWNGPLLVLCQLFLLLFLPYYVSRKLLHSQIYAHESRHYAGLYRTFSAYRDLGNHKLVPSLKHTSCFTKNFTGRVPKFTNYRVLL